jgi:hypothetical protein
MIGKSKEILIGIYYVIHHRISLFVLQKDTNNQISHNDKN